MRPRKSYARVRLALLSGFLASAALTSCSFSSSSAHPGVLRIALLGSPGSPDPALASTPASIFLSSLLYSGLVKFGTDLHVIPELAVSIPTISADGRTYTFTMRQDARFADGRHCTGADLAYSLARALSPTTHSPLARRYLGGIRGAKHVEEGLTNRLSGVSVRHRLKVRIRLNHADAGFLAKLAFPVSYVVDRRVAGRHLPLLDSAAGTGALVLSARQPDGTLLLSPRRHYYGLHVQLKSLLLLSVPTQSRAIDLYKKGAVDIAEVPDDQFAQLSGRSDFHDSAALDAYYVLCPGGHSSHVAFNLDRDRLVRDAMPSLSPLAVIVPPAVPDYLSSPPDGGTQGPSGDAPRVNLQLEQKDWASRMLERGLLQQWRQNRRNGANIQILHATNLLPDPSVWLRLVLPQTSSAWYRKMLKRASRLTNDPVARMNILSSAETWALKRGFIIPLASGNVGYLVKQRVDGIQITPLGLMPANNNWSAVSVT